MIVANAAWPPQPSSGGLVNFATGPLYCHQDTNFLTQVKGYAAYSLPADVQIAATFQSIPGQSLSANVTYQSAQVAQSLGRQLSTATTVTVNAIPPGTEYGDRLNQLDLRLGKNFRLQRYRLNAVCRCVQPVKQRRGVERERQLLGIAQAAVGRQAPLRQVWCAVQLLSRRPLPELQG